MLGFLEKEIRKDGIPMLDTGENPDAPAPREMIDLEVSSIAIHFAMLTLIINVVLFSLLNRTIFLPWYEIKMNRLNVISRRWKVMVWTFIRWWLLKNSYTASNSLNVTIDTRKTFGTLVDCHLRYRPTVCLSKVILRSVKNNNNKNLK